MDPYPDRGRSGKLTPVKALGLGSCRELFSNLLLDALEAAARFWKLLPKSSACEVGRLYQHGLVLGSPF